MVAALEFEDLVPLAEGAGGAHRVEIGLRAGRYETHLLGARHGGDDLAGELDPPAVIGKERRSQGDPGLGGGGDLGVSVADQHRAGAEQEVDVLLAVLVPDMAAASLADHDLAREIAKGAAG